jgi:hypothetical protein
MTRFPLAVAGLTYAVAALGCEQTFPRPLTATQTAQARSGAELAHYLSQPDATPGICSGKSRGPHIGPMARNDLEDLVDGLTDGAVPPAVWRGCADALLASAPADESATFLDATGKAHRSLLRDAHFEKADSSPLRARLAVLHEIFLFRPTGIEPHTAVLTPLTTDLRNARAHRKLGPEATRYGQDLLATLDLGRGIWEGQPVTVATLNELQARNDEAALRRFALRLPDAAARTEARRRIIRLHIAASNWLEVREHASEVEALVLATGRYAVNLDDHPPLKGTPDFSRFLLHGVLVRQDLASLRATILGYGGGQSGISVVSVLDLHGALRVELRGISQPVSLCGAPSDLDVAPCIPPASVAVANPLAYLDADGNFHFSEHAALSTAVALVHDQPSISLPIQVAGQTLATLELPVYFERPEDLVFAAGWGGRGPNLGVRTAQRDAERLVFTVNAGKAPMLAVVELRDAAGFSIVSRGGDGASGSPGSDGLTGSDGTSGVSASCPSFSGGRGGDGGNGGNGQDGGDGADGGNGGDIRVEIACGVGDCVEVGALVQRVVRSQGGDGGAAGAGGRGGRGGRGGAGGSGTTCTDSNGNTFSLSGGLNGSEGMNGSDGRNGSPGAMGKPGRVALVTAREPTVDGSYNHSVAATASALQGPPQYRNV